MNNEPQSVTPLADPSITQVVDSAGKKLGNPGITEDTQLILSGVAPANSVAVLLDNGKVIGSASAIAPGVWAVPMTAALGSHRFTVKVVDSVESSAWVIAVETTARPPTIFNVVDSKGEVVHNGTTLDTTVLVGGSAAASTTVEFFHNSASMGNVAVNESSLWTQLVPGLTLGAHDFQVIAGYGSNPVSNVRSLFVLSRTVEDFEHESEVLIVDQRTCSSGLLITSLSGVRASILLVTNPPFPVIGFKVLSVSNLDGSAAIQLNFPVLSGRINFDWFYALDSQGAAHAVVSYFNSAGVRLDVPQQLPMPYSPEIRLLHQTFSASAGESIAALRIELTGSISNFYIDKIGWPN